MPFLLLLPVSGHLSRGGAGIAQWLEHRTRDWKVAGSNPCWNGGRIFFSRVDFLCWLLFRYPFHPRVTTVARKKSRSFCPKCRWQVTAKHAYTLRIEPCFGIGHSLSLICQMTSEDIKHQLNNNNIFPAILLYPQQSVPTLPYTRRHLPSAVPLISDDRLFNKDRQSLTKTTHSSYAISAVCKLVPSQSINRAELHTPSRYGRIDTVQALTNLLVCSR